MTKTKTKLRIAAAMLAVLLIACAWVGAVSADETVTFSYDTDNLVNIWNTGVNYWTTNESGTATIPVNITAGAASVKQLSGYNAEVSMTLKGGGAQVDAITPVNKITQWTDEVGFVNGKKIAYSAQTALFDITDEKNIFDMNITTSSLTAGKTYTISLVNPSVALSGTVVKTADDVKSATVTPPRDFSLVVIAKPKITSINFAGYQTINLPSTILTIALYREHGDTVLTNVTADNFGSMTYENLNWDKTGTSIYEIRDWSYETTDPLKKELILSPTDGIGTLELKFKSGDSVSVPVKVENWKQSDYNNYDSSKGYDSTSNWSFVTNYTQTYIVGAGKIDTTAPGWDSRVEIPGIQRGGSGAAWNFTASYVDSDSGIGTYEISNKKSGGNFLVTKNTVNDAAKTVTITLTGKRVGDANTDDYINIVDSAVVGIHIFTAGGILNDEQMIYADCNSAAGSGTITVADVLAINKYLVGIAPW